MQITLIKDFHDSTQMAHLDIKLENILLQSNDLSDIRSSLVSLIDFGSAMNLKKVVPYSKEASSEHMIFEGNINFSSLD